MLALAAVTPSSGAEIQLGEGQPDDTLAIRTLVEKFDSPDVVIRTEPTLVVQPAFVNYALACAKLDGAAPILAEVLAGGDYSQQARVAAAVALEAIGPDAIVAEPALRGMLSSPEEGENNLACGIIRGIGPDAVPLLPLVRALLNADSFHTQYWACRAIAAMGEDASDATGDLCQLLTNQPASVRRNACIALGEVAVASPMVPEVVELLAKVAKEDPVAPVREAAEGAIKTIIGYYPFGVEAPADPTCSTGLDRQIAGRYHLRSRTTRFYRRSIG
jgi:hypothetical protein